VGGRDVARRLVAGWPAGATGVVSGLSVATAQPLRSVVPAVVDPADPPGRLLLRTEVFGPGRLVVARQGGAEVGRHRLRHATPHRSLSVPGSVVAGADPDGGTVELSLV
jgi:hypothetical protein